MKVGLRRQLMHQRGPDSSQWPAGYECNTRYFFLTVDIRLTCGNCMRLRCFGDSTHVLHSAHAICRFGPQFGHPVNLFQSTSGRNCRPPERQTRWQNSRAHHSPLMRFLRSQLCLVTILVDFLASGLTVHVTTGDFRWDEYDPHRVRQVRCE